MAVLCEMLEPKTSQKTNQGEDLTRFSLDGARKDISNIDESMEMDNAKDHGAVS